MTGPEHYREAEQLIFDAEHQRLYGEGEAVANNMLARAQVHATLALAASAPLADMVGELAEIKDRLEGIRKEIEMYPSSDTSGWRQS